MVSIYISLRRASPEIRVTNADADRKRAESDKLKVETALLQDQQIADLQTDLSEACEELASMKIELRKMKDIQSAKDREFLLLKSELADKNEVLQKQNDVIEAKNKQIEKQVEALTELQNLHRRWEIGIEILLTQMHDKDLKPLWYPTKKED